MGLLYNYENYLYRAKNNKIIKLNTINIQIEKEYSIPEDYIIENIYVANNIIYANTEYQLYIIDINDGFIIETKPIDYGIIHVMVSENDHLYIVTNENTIEEYQELIKVDEFVIDSSNYGHLIKGVIKGPHIYSITEDGYIIVFDIEYNMMLKVVKLNSIDTCIDLFVSDTKIFIVCKRDDDTIIIIYNLEFNLNIIYILKNLGDDIKGLLFEENLIIGGFNYIYNVSNNTEYQIEGYVEDIVSKQNLIYCITNNPKNFLSLQLEDFRISNKIYAINDVLEFEEYYSIVEDDHNIDIDIDIDIHDSEIDSEESVYEEDTIQQSTMTMTEFSDNETNTENCMNDNLITLESYTQEDEPIMIYVLNTKNIFEKAICITKYEWNNYFKSDIDNLKKYPDTDEYLLNRIPMNIMSLSTTPYDKNITGYGSRPTGEFVIKLPINQMYITYNSCFNIKQEYKYNKIWYALPLFKRRITNLKGIIGQSMNHGQIPGFVIYKLFKRNEIHIDTIINSSDNEWGSGDNEIKLLEDILI